MADVAKKEREPQDADGARRQRVLVGAVVTGVALVAAAVRIAFPDAKIDAITVALLALAVIPWLGDIIESLEGPGGWRVKYRELDRRTRQTEERVAEVEQTADLAGESAQDTGGAFREAERVSGAAGGPGTTSAGVDLDAELPALVERYNEIRRTQRSGGRRTAEMTAVTQRMVELARRAGGLDWTSLIASRDNRGERLAGYASLYALPDAAAARPLAESVVRIEDKPFGQYWGLRALRQVVPKADAASKSAVEPLLRDFAYVLGPSGDRRWELDQLFREAYGDGEAPGPDRGRSPD